MSTNTSEGNNLGSTAHNVTGITPMSLQNTLKEMLEAQYVDIEDMSGQLSYLPPFDRACALNRDLLAGCGQAFNAVIVSSHFEKKSTLARHRLVNSTLKAEIAAIHAWTPKCFTPAEWEKKQADGGPAPPPAS
ncbi:MAG: hypothetical protein LQ342_007618 [Letrouitia transgressa]|nr:MAG: hypothetical protein LQ342_007618 [Letrouitia transgressa]